MMFSLPPTVRIFLSARPADMRRSFDGLAAMTREIINADPLCGHLFVFRNRRADRVKILWWDRGGFCLWYKRLEEGMFHFPAANGCSIEVEPAELALILEGIDLAGASKRRRFEPMKALDAPVGI